MAVAQTDIGRVMPLFKGDYNSDTTYSIGDIVLYHGSSYWFISEEDAKNVTPGTDPTKWRLLIDASVIPALVAQASEYVAAALAHANTAGEQALLSRSWAKGDTGARAGEDTDNSRYYAGLAAVYAASAAGQVGSYIVVTDMDDSNKQYSLTFGVANGKLFTSLTPITE